MSVICEDTASRIVISNFEICSLRIFVPGTGKHSKHGKAPPRRRMDAIAWALFAIGLAMVAVSTFVLVDLSLRVPPAFAEGMKYVLFAGCLLTLASIGAKVDLLDRLKPILGG